MGLYRPSYRKIMYFHFIFQIILKKATKRLPAVRLSATCFHTCIMRRGLFFDARIRGTFSTVVFDVSSPRASGVSGPMWRNRSYIVISHRSIGRQSLDGENTL